MDESASTSIGLCAQIACILDVAVCKPGNVCLIHEHADMSCVDFLLSAAAIAPVMDQAATRTVGETILGSIQATRRVTRVNTNLGIVLLLAPLAKAISHGNLASDLRCVLTQLTVDDARAAYEAIRLANPGGLGSAPEQDVANEPTVTLRDAMGLAADRDLVARQYVNDFAQVFEGVEILREQLGEPGRRLGDAVASTFLSLLAKYPDSLIARKYGANSAREVSQIAVQLLEEPHDPEHTELLARIGNRNPGTTADILTASLFIALHGGMIRLPLSESIRTDP